MGIVKSTCPRTHAPGHDFYTITGEVSRGDPMLYSGTDSKSNITEYTLAYKDCLPLLLFYLSEELDLEFRV